MRYSLQVSTLDPAVLGITGVDDVIVGRFSTFENGKRLPVVRVNNIIVPLERGNVVGTAWPDRERHGQSYTA